MKLASMVWVCLMFGLFAPREGNGATGEALEYVCGRAFEGSATALASCEWYIVAVKDYYNGALFCINPEYDQHRLAKMVSAYLTANPGSWPLSAFNAVALALEEIFPCD